MLDELNTKKSGRSIEVQLKYDQYKQQMQTSRGAEIPCPFCEPLATSRRQVGATETMMVVENDFPYEFFDNREVARHLMIVPKRHIGEYVDFYDDEQREYWQLISDYQSQQYAIFTRAVGDEMRSVPFHLHTHVVAYAS